MTPLTATNHTLQIPPSHLTINHQTTHPTTLTTPQTTPQDHDDYDFSPPPPPPKYGPEPPPTVPSTSSSLALSIFDDAKRGRDALRQPSLWIDADVAAALREAMNLESARQAESFICGEAIQLMPNSQQVIKPTNKWCCLCNPLNLRTFPLGLSLLHLQTTFWMSCVRSMGLRGQSIQG